MCERGLHIKKKKDWPGAPVRCDFLYFIFDWAKQCLLMLKTFCFATSQLLEDCGITVPLLPHLSLMDISVAQVYTRNFSLCPQSQLRKIDRRTPANAYLQLFKEMLLRNCISAYRQSNFFHQFITWSPQFLKELLLRNWIRMSAIFLAACNFFVDFQYWTSALQQLSDRSGFGLVGIRVQY